MGALSVAAELDLGAYRPEHVDERVRRALAREHVADLSALVEHLRRDARARARFRRAVAVPASRLFRDEEQFALLERRVLPDLAAAGAGIRAWSAGCAAGQELYSLALVLERMGHLDRADLLGSDLLEENVSAAARGADARVSAAVRARVRWEQRDLVADPPPSGRWALILCRNVGIYLAPPAKHALHAKLAGRLARGGYLMLGRAERVSDADALGLDRIAPHTYRRPR
jgi:chemotaxis protein methyltransferase CheR